MRIGRFDTDRRVMVIAEIGNNHEGDFDLALELIALAARAGADAVKFQTIVPERLVSVGEADRIAQLRRFQFCPEQFAELAERAEREGVLFLSTPFDLDSVSILNPLVPAFKIASGDNTFWPLLDTVARTGKPVILSSGLTGLDEIRASRDRIRAVWRASGVPQEMAILHCVVSYPTPPEQANLGAIRALAELGETVGYSDHTLGIDAAVLSVPLGARIIEKHFTISKTRSSFRDHQLSADPADLAELVQRVREAELLLGDGVKRVLPAEAAARTAARRSIVARRGLAAGQVLGWQDLDWVRPGSGLPPGRESELVGGRLRAAVGQGTQLCPEELEFPVCPICGSTDAELLTIVTVPPPGEKDYGIPAERYRRALYRCGECSGFINWHGLLPTDYYRGDYNAASWPERLLEPFRRIRALPADQSDNKQRVARIIRHLAERGRTADSTRVLDVGSGLCVFLAELGEQWGGNLACVDPDPAAIAHAVEYAGVNTGHAGTLDDFEPTDRFDLITFNKVLEHVPDPARLLGQAAALLRPGGTVYLELPDGELALQHGRLNERQEFFAEHLAVYTPEALARLAGEAGFRAMGTSSLREPSGKCTVYGFLEPLREPA